VSGAAALVLHCNWLVEWKDFSGDWFEAGALCDLDALSLSVLDVSVGACAALAALIAGWALEVWHGLCLAGLLA
jgi:hypothetical protein